MEERLISHRPKGTGHPHYHDFLYEVDYGYLRITLSKDGGRIDIWKGSNMEAK
jgi:inorganic pyrophosphatase